MAFRYVQLWYLRLNLRPGLKFIVLMQCWPWVFDPSPPVWVYSWRLSEGRLKFKLRGGTRRLTWRSCYLFYRLGWRTVTSSHPLCKQCRRSLCLGYTLIWCVVPVVMTHQPWLFYSIREWCWCCWFEWPLWVGCILASKHFILTQDPWFQGSKWSWDVFKGGLACLWWRLLQRNRVAFGSMAHMVMWPTKLTHRWNRITLLKVSHR
jgi:hypothetical protein